MAGLTAAYRLLQAGIPCEIFEASERTGGRMLTKTGFNAEGMFCELGGELVDTEHTDLMALAGELGVGIQELKRGDAGADRYFFGGKHYTDKELIPLSSRSPENSPGMRRAFTTTRRTLRPRRGDTTG